jgi:hypothetical protein
MAALAALAACVDMARYGSPCSHGKIDDDLGELAVRAL